MTTSSTSAATLELNISVIEELVDQPSLDVVGTKELGRIMVLIEDGQPATFTVGTYEYTIVPKLAEGGAVHLAETVRRSGEHPATFGPYASATRLGESRGLTIGTVAFGSTVTLAK